MSRNEYESPDYLDDNSADYSTCEHGIYKGLLGGYCDACDKYEESRGGLDQCLQCGRYCWADQLDEHQVHKHGKCRNPAEY